MKKYLLIFTLFSFLGLNAQFQELGVGVGYANYLGDLNTSTSLAQQFRFQDYKLSLSIGYRYNFKKLFSVGFNFYHMNLAGYDSDNASPVGYDASFYRKNRNFSFHTAINQGFLDFRYEPFRKDNSWSKSKIHISPYIGAGFGFFKFNPKTMYNGQEYELQPLGTEGQGLPGYNAPYSLFEIGIPLSFGIRITDKNRKFGVSIDFTNTVTFTDYIDDVSSYYVNPAIVNANYSPAKAALVNALANRNTFPTTGPATFTEVTYHDQKRGNSNFNDHFMTGQIKFSYYFKNSDKDAYYKCCGF
jgi:hypothetical protein